MNRRQRAYYFLTAFASVTIVFTLVYIAGMSVFEGETRTLSEALLVVVQSFTTTGYGEDAASWTTAQMRLFAVFMQVTGVFFVFMTLPLFVAPWLKDRFSTTVPTSAEGLSDHVIICGYTSRTEMLVEELNQFDQEYVLIERDHEQATTWYEDGLRTIHGDPESTDTLMAVGIDRARALVCDVDDETNASIALAADQLPPDAEITTFVENADMAPYHRYAGAENIFKPRQLIAQSLAQKVLTMASKEMSDSIDIDGEIDIVEVPVQSGSTLDGTTLEESGIREQTGANVVGGWFRGQFVSAIEPDHRIDSHTVLLVAGNTDQLERLQDLARATARRQRYGPVIICGYGEVGSTVRERILEAGLSATVIDKEDIAGVDVVGDATDPETFRRAEIGDASTVVIALPEDTTAVFASLVVSDMDADVEVVVRANETDNIEKLYRAGADYVLALATISGRMLASTVLEEDILTFDQGVEVIRLPVGNLAGQSLEGAAIRAKTDCTVLAIERNGDVITDFDPTFTFETGDHVVVAGPDRQVSRFSKLTG